MSNEEAATRTIPSHADSIREEVEPFRHMTPEERLEWFVRLQRSMDAFVALRGERAASRDGGDRGLGRHWRDPDHGRPG